MRVLITGANGALGHAVVEAFSRADAEVFGADRAWGSTPAGVHAITADLMIPDGCAAAVRAADPVDVLVHLVGGFAGGTKIEATGSEIWEKMLAINFRCAVEMFRAALPGMRSRKHGRILAVGSRAGIDPAPHIAAYGASKAALIHLVRSLAEEVKQDGITANVVLPSTIDTAVNRAAMPKADFTTWVAPAAIASLLVWLASDAGAAVSGAAIPIYGRA